MAYRRILAAIPTPRCAGDGKNLSIYFKCDIVKYICEKALRKASEYGKEIRYESFGSGRRGKAG